MPTPAPCTATFQSPSSKQLTGGQTSSAPRRFLPPSSIPSPLAHQKPTTTTDAHSTNRFAKPTSVRFSTPFAKKPPVKKPEDEIETNVEEQGSSSPSLPSRLRFSSSLSRHQEAINDANDEGETLAVSRADDLAPGGADDLSDLLHFEQSQGINAIWHREPERDGQGTGPTGRKRRRISSTDDAIDEVVEISSSPSLEHLHAMHMSDDEDFHAGSKHIRPLGTARLHEEDIEEEATSSPVGPASAIVSTKFRLPTPAVFHTPTLPTRPAFKLPQGQTAATHDYAIGSSLPDAFSPSRRRDKKDYIPGGAADTVRSWVLALAAEEANVAPAYTEGFRVVEMREDYGDGRFVLVKDESCRRWLLVKEGTKAAGAGKSSSAQEVTVGCLVGIKGSSTTLNLHINDSKGLEAEGCSVLNSRGDEWLVGIMWDVLE